MIQRHEINDFELVEFGNETKEEKKLLKQFVNFHWVLYKDDPQYIPLLDYEYFGLKLIGMTGFFEPKNLFYKHAEMRFFLVYKNGEIVGRCNAFTNSRHNEQWKDKVDVLRKFALNRPCYIAEHIKSFFELSDIEYNCYPDIKNKKDSVVIAPNPNNGTFFIYNNSETFNGDIIITNIEGKIVYSKKNVSFIRNEKYFFDLTKSQNGIYILQLRSTNISKTKRIMIIK